MKRTAMRWRRWAALVLVVAATVLVVGRRGSRPERAAAPAAARHLAGPAGRAAHREAAAGPRARVMPAAVDRAQRFLDEHPLGAGVIDGLREIAGWQRDLAQDTGPASPAERAARRQRRDEFRVLLREVLTRMEPGQRAAMRRARLTVIQLARSVDNS